MDKLGRVKEQGKISRRVQRAQQTEEDPNKVSPSHALGPSCDQ
jgi:hypothetical protein